MTTTPLLPAAAVQKQMWVVDRMDPAASIYNEDVAFWIDGDLDDAALERAWRILAARHEVLRYVFDDSGAELRLRIVPEVDLEFVHTDVDDDDAALAWGRDLVQEVYDITDRPPVRFGLAHVGAGRTLLVIGFHHAIIDVGSIGLVFEELAELYAGLTGGSLLDLPPVERTYSEFVAGTLTGEHRARVDEVRADVVQRLTAGGGAPSAELPSDRPRPPLKSTRGQLTGAAFPAGIVGRLRAFAAEHRVTPFQVLLAGMSGLLHRYTRQDELVFGVGTAGRPPGYEDSVGPFACFVPVRMRPGGSTFEQLLDAAGTTTEQMSAAQYVPFSQVVSEVITTRDAGRSPLVQMVFNAPPLTFREDTLTGCRMTTARLPRTRARVDMLVNLEWHGQDVYATAEFDDTLYDEETVSTFLGQLGVLIDSALADPRADVDRLPLPGDGAPIAVPRGAGEAAELGDDGFVAAVAGEAVVVEPGGAVAPVGVEGDLLVDGAAVPGLRVRRTRDGRLRWRRPDDAAQAATGAASSGSRVERHVVETCRTLLENPAAAAEDDFFVAGGHSMMAARLVQQLGEEFGVDVPLLMVFEHPVLSELAVELDAQFPELDEVLARLETLSETEVSDLWEQLPPDASDADPGSVTQLSGHEQPFWLMEQFAPGSAVNTLTLRIRGRGEVDGPALERALNRVIDREEILRTGYGADESMNSLRRVHRTAGATVRVEHTDTAGAEAIARAESTTGFDIAAAPLIRCTLVLTGGDGFEIVLACHHLVMDYWGVTRVMLPALSAFYAEETGGEPAVLPPPEGYRGAILREAAWQDSAQSRSELEYWREQLQGMRPAEFRPDRQRPPHVDFRGAVAVAEATPEQVAALDAYVQEHRTTRFVVVAAAVAAAARAWSDSDDVSFMSPAENRRHEADARVMGTFVNLITLRYRFSPELTWNGLVTQSRRLALDAYANQSVPISTAMANVGQKGVTASGEGRYLVLNVFSDSTGLDLAGTDVDGGVIVQHDSASTDLELSVLAGAGRLGLTMKYRPSLWEPGTVQQILDDVLTSLERVATAGDTPVASSLAVRA